MGILGGPATRGFQQDTAIRYRWTKGETLRYRTTIQNTTTVSGLPSASGDMNVEQTMVQVSRAVARDVAADGTTILEQLIESVRMDVRSAMGNITIDSTSPDPGANSNPTMAKMMLAMIGEPFTVVVTSTGGVRKVEGFSRIIEKVFANAPQDPASASVLNSMKSSFSDEAFLNTMGQGFTQFPDRPLKPGDSWTNQIAASYPMMGSVTTSIAATLKAIEGTGADQVARVALQLSMKQGQGAPAFANVSGMSMQLGESSGEGDSIFDLARGRLLRSTTRTTMPMTMSGPGPDGTPFNMKSTVKSTMTVELIQQ
jgi:hypothetical protein